MNLKPFKHNDWVKIYEGQWSFLTSSYWGDHFTKEIKFGRLPFMPCGIIFCSQHRSSGWMRQQDRDVLGKYLSAQVLKNPKLIKNITAKLRLESKSFLKFIKQSENSKPTLKLLEVFWRKHVLYWHPHIFVKYVVDYLEPGLLKKHLRLLQKTRLAIEPVLNRTENFLYGFVKSLSQQTKLAPKLLLCLTRQEINQYFKSHKLPNQSELKQRQSDSVFVFDKKSSKFFTGKYVSKIKKLIFQDKILKNIKGVTAYPGKVIGRVQIITNPHNAKKFKIGDILITGASRPEFLPIMHKAAAFVTDSGGILSHAAITAREMKKPCVIGTKYATKILKDGDMVEVDANKGIVKRL